MRYENPLYLAEEPVPCGSVTGSRRLGYRILSAVIGRDVSRVDQRLVIKPGWEHWEAPPRFHFLCVLTYTGRTLSKQDDEVFT